MLEKFKEFKETLSERIRSPFIGSFIITWSVLHWKIFALFLFEQEDIKIQERISSIEKYISSKDSCQLFFNPILITLGLLLAYSVLNAIALAIKLGYDNWASPAIQSILYNKNIVEKTKYDKIKKQYSELRKEYDDDKDKRINAEKEAKDLSVSFETYRKNSFEVTPLSSITAVLNTDIEWENFHKYPDGQEGLETFKCDNSGFKLNDGRTLKLENIKVSPNGKILSFDKIVDDKVLPNFLIQDSEFNYHGIENDNIQITYRKKKANKVIVNSAKYYCENNFIDVTDIIQRLADNNKLEFIITNELMGGDPGFNKKKEFSIDYIINGTQTSLTAHENNTVKLQ